MSKYVECPYCEEDNEITFDDYEGAENFEFECRYCGKEFEVTVEYEPTFCSSEIEYKICKNCGESFRYTGQKFPIPKKFKHLNCDEYIICDKCYFQNIRENFK